MSTSVKNESVNVENSAEKAIENTEAGRIWSEIKDKSIEIFALPNQKVNQYCSPMSVDPTKLYLIVSATSVLPALETTIGNNFSVELVNKYVVVSRIVK